jgi:hypothetical protein
MNPSDAPPSLQARDSLDLYEASVPVFQHYLERLAALVQAAERHACGAADEAAVLAARLAPDMFPLRQQVEIAANFSLRACYPLAGQTVPVPPRYPPTLAGLQWRLAQARQALHCLPPSAFAGEIQRPITADAGQATLHLPAHQFLLHYALPNFLFHLSTAYAILRHIGVPVGKQDFDGFHRYGG